MIITATVIDLTKKRTWINHKRRQSGWRDASPNHPLIHPTLATPTNQQSNPENPSRTREFRRKPVPNHRHLPINPPTAQRERKTYDAAQKQPPPRHRAAAGFKERQERRRDGRNSGAARRRAGQPAGEESVINAAATSERHAKA